MIGVVAALLGFLGFFNVKGNRNRNVKGLGVLATGRAPVWGGFRDTP